MSYQTYTTEAIVCGARPQVGADVAYLLFTQEHGMVWATARSVREERSRQRYALQPFGQVRVSLVKGKSGWRIGSVEALGNPFMGARTREQRHLLAQCVATVRRYVRGEGAQPAVYRDLAALCRALSQHEPYAPHAATYFTVRALTNLGYLAPEPALDPITTAPVWYQADVPLGDAVRARLREAEQVSHL